MIAKKINLFDEVPDFAYVWDWRRLFQAHAKANYGETHANNRKWSCETQRKPRKRQRQCDQHNCSSTTDFVAKRSAEEASNWMCQIGEARCETK